MASNLTTDVHLQQEAFSKFSSVRQSQMHIFPPAAPSLQLMVLSLGSIGITHAHVRLLITGIYFITLFLSIDALTRRIFILFYLKDFSAPAYWLLYCCIAMPLWPLWPLALLNCYQALRYSMTVFLSCMSVLLCMQFSPGISIYTDTTSGPDYIHVTGIFRYYPQFNWMLAHFRKFWCEVTRCGHKWYRNRYRFYTYKKGLIASEMVKSNCKACNLTYLSNNPMYSSRSCS